MPGLSYVYLTWVYFLFYLGAGYPTYYYPYIISTLLDFVPTECGGTGQKGLMPLCHKHLVFAIFC